MKTFQARPASPGKAGLNYAPILNLTTPSPEPWQGNFLAGTIMIFNAIIFLNK